METQSPIKIIMPPRYWTRNLPANFKFQKYMSIWQHSMSSLTVMRSLSTTNDGREWIHVTVSRPDRLPTYEELVKVKSEFLGDDVEAYQVFAKRSDHVNLHMFCLHLWASTSGEKCVANLKDLTNEEAI